MPDRNVWGLVRLWSSQPDLEMIASGTQLPKGFALMSQSHLMTLVMCKTCAIHHYVEGCNHVTCSVRAWLAANAKVKKWFYTRFGNILRTVMMLKSAPCPCLVFGSRLVQNNWICIFFKNCGEMNVAIKTAFWPWLQRHAICPLVPSGLVSSILAGQSR